jgi:hypothetical protein
MAKKQPEKLLPPKSGAALADWQAYWDATAPTEEQKAKVRETARIRAVEAERERRANAFPILTDQLVKADVGFWRGHVSKVIRDAGPARDGARTIEIERLHGPRAGETIAVRRDRVSLVPGVIGQSAAAGR